MENLQKIIKALPSFVVPCADQYDRARLLTELGKHGIKTEGSAYATELNVQVKFNSQEVKVAKCLGDDRLEEATKESIVVMYSSLGADDTPHPPLTC